MQKICELEFLISTCKILRMNNNISMKTKILKILEASREKFVSGENIAEQLGVTRATVSQYVKILKSEGYMISASTKIGYRLENFCDVLSREGIISNLSDENILGKIICLDEIDSTNNYAKKLALDGAPEGTLITANHQTSGRGRRGHSFVSPAGTGLYMTLILRPNVETPEFQMITVAAAVAVCFALEKLVPGIKLGIKWVNDIFLGGKKICGILTEAVTSIESGEIESVIIGIGVNIRTENFSPEISGIAGSIFDGNSDTKNIFSRNELAALISEHIMRFAKKLDAPEIIAAYRERSILTGENIRYMIGDESRKARVLGIDDSGGLEIIGEDGVREILRSGEVFMIRKT